MKITIERLLEGKRIFIPRGNKKYFNTKTYVEPFITKMSEYTSEFTAEVKLPKGITDSENIPENTEFTRVLVQAVLPLQKKNKYKNVVGMIYVLDNRKPILKFYIGSLNEHGDLINTSIVETQYIEPKTPFNYEVLDTIVDKIPALETETFMQTLENSKFEVRIPDIDERLGAWIRRSIKESWDYDYGIIKIGAGTCVDVYKKMFVETDSKVYVGNLNIISYAHIYNAFCHVITNDDSRDILNRCEKILILFSIIKF